MKKRIAAVCGLPLFSCLFPPEQSRRNAVGGFFFVLLDQVGVEILCCGDFVVAQLLRYRDHIRTIRNQHGSNRMPERMGIDMGQIVPCRKFPQP